MRRTIGVLAAVAVLAWLVPSASAGTGFSPWTRRVSVASDGRQANGESWGPAPVAAHARVVAFSSVASNLVAGDTNRTSDVFVRKASPGVTRRASLGRHGGPADGGSTDAVVSAGGRYVAFTSRASNLVPRDTNDRTDVFVRDLALGTVERVSVSTAGVQGSRASHVDGISPDGRYVVFSSAAGQLAEGDTNGQSDVFVRDRTLRVTTRVSVSPAGVEGRRDSYNGSVSGGGRLVVFTSWADDLVPGDTNDESDVFVRDLAAGTTSLVSAGPTGTPAGAWSDSGRVSADGRRVSFVSAARDLVPTDTNRTADAFVRDLVTGTVTRVSVGRGGRQANGMTTSAVISSNGRFVAFSSLATNLARRPTMHVQVFVRDLRDRRTTLVSRSSGGRVAAGDCFQPDLSPGGRFVSFSSRAANLVPGDTAGHADIFVRRWRR